MIQRVHNKNFESAPDELKAYFGGLVRGEEDVGRLDVSVDDAPIGAEVQVLNCLCNFNCHLIPCLPWQHLPPAFLLPCASQTFSRLVCAREN